VSSTAKGSKRSLQCPDFWPHYELPVLEHARNRFIDTRTEPASLSLKIYKVDLSNHDLFPVRDVFSFQRSHADP
jgi:hypothetical protein